MAADALSILSVVFVPLAVLPEVKSDNCQRDVLFGREYFYCKYGCCGSDEHYCCDMNVGVIVGGVIGGLAFIAFVVTVACYLAKRQGYRGRVVTTAPIVGSSNVTVVQTQTTGGPGVPSYPGMHMYSPPAGGAMPPPPPYYPHGGQNPGVVAPAMPAYAFYNPYNTGATTTAFP